MFTCIPERIYIPTTSLLLQPHHVLKTTMFSCSCCSAKRYFILRTFFLFEPHHISIVLPFLAAKWNVFLFQGHTCFFNHFKITTANRKVKVFFFVPKTVAWASSASNDSRFYILFFTFENRIIIIDTFEKLQVKHRVSNIIVNPFHVVEVIISCSLNQSSRFRTTLFASHVGISSENFIRKFIK